MKDLAFKAFLAAASLALAASPVAAAGPSGKPAKVDGLKQVDANDDGQASRDEPASATQRMFMDMDSDGRLEV